MKFIKRIICKFKGHKFEIYEFSTGYYGNDIEMAGFCNRCKLDTHEGIKQYGEK